MNTELISFDITTAAPIDRKATRPNAVTRKIWRGSLGYTCSLCGCESDWSKYQECEAGRLEMGHTIAAEIGGPWKAWNITAQCYTCNRDAYFAGMQDLRPYVLASEMITRWLPGPLFKTRADRRDDAPLTGIPGEKERRAARFIRCGW